jgi:hypothetical protein
VDTFGLIFCSGIATVKWQAVQFTEMKPRLLGKLLLWPRAGLILVFLSPAAPATDPQVETDAKKVLALQWMQWEPPNRLSALDLATQPQPKFGDALTFLALGFDGKSQPKYPYAVPPANADNFWDWLAGAFVELSPAPSPKKMADALAAGRLEDALATTEKIIDNYYSANNRGLMEKVDANFVAGNARRAIFELISFAAQAVRSLEAQAVKVRKQAEESRAQAVIEAAEARQVADFENEIGKTVDEQMKLINDSIAAFPDQIPPRIRAALDSELPLIKSAARDNANAVGAAADKLVGDIKAIEEAANKSAGSLKAIAIQKAKSSKDLLKNALHGDTEKARAASQAAKAKADSDKNTADKLSEAVEAELTKLENVRLCYASVAAGADGKSNYRKKVSDWVSAKFRPASK